MPDDPHEPMPMASMPAGLADAKALAAWVRGASNTAKTLLTAALSKKQHQQDPAPKAARGKAD
jgi:hypothetical protein